MELTDNQLFGNKILNIMEIRLLHILKSDVPIILAEAAKVNAVVVLSRMVRTV